MNPALRTHLVSPAGLATLLKQARNGQPLKGDAFAEATGTSRSMVSNVIRGHRLPNRDLVERWARVCGTDPAPLFAALEMADQFEGSWAVRLSGGQRGHQETLADLQAQTTLFRSASFDLVPGGLQTADYASAVLTQAVEFHGGTVNESDIAGAVAARRRIQDGFMVEGRQFRFLIWEAALRTRILEPAGMVAQCERVLELAAMSQVDVRVLRFDGRWRLFPHSTFVCYDDQVVMLEPLPGPVAYESGDVDLFARAFDLWFDDAAGGDDLTSTVGEVVDWWLNV